ncbi:MAG: hypothetical protein HS127_11215 [Planctomycetia bacterium]|nr:hypothetical protein [Planctomycetia bacterium]
MRICRIALPEIEAIRLALAHKDDLCALGALSESVKLMRVCLWEQRGACTKWQRN